jgi:hypothetical protein
MGREVPVADIRRSAERCAVHDSAAGSGRRKRFGEQYRPDPVRCLLIAGALPGQLDRFFYRSDARRADYLFLGVMQVLYPGLKEEFLAARRPSALKENMLRRFQADGFYLLDILDEAPRRSYGLLPRDLAALLAQVDAVADPQTPIVLIKATVFEAVGAPLRAAGYQRVFQRPIPFPSQGWQHRFCELFVEALRELGVPWSAP